LRLDDSARRNALHISNQIYVRQKQMKFKKMLLLLVGLILSVTINAPPISAQTIPSGKGYQQLTQAQRTVFVAEQARRIAREISGSEYEFTPAFENDIQQAVNQYVRRIGNGAGDRLWKGDARYIFERGQVHAPTLITVFKAHNLSPLIGLYIPWIESEYVNIQTPNSLGAIGMFQFLPKTGERFGLSAQDLLDVSKSADAAARYITDNLGQFKDDEGSARAAGVQSWRTKDSTRSQISHQRAKQAM
jgi:hypothetical protein